MYVPCHLQHDMCTLYGVWSYVCTCCHMTHKNISVAASCHYKHTHMHMYIRTCINIPHGSGSRSCHMIVTRLSYDKQNDHNTCTETPHLIVLHKLRSSELSCLYKLVEIRTYIPISTYILNVGAGQHAQSICTSSAS